MVEVGAKKEKAPERRVLVTIRSQAGKKPVTFGNRRYFEILGELTLRNVDRVEAAEAAKWCDRTAKPGDRKELKPDITLEVKEDG